MRKLLIAAMLALALPLGGCAGIGTTFSNIGTAASTSVAIVNGTRITQNQLNAGMAAYDTLVLTPIATYRYSDAAHTVERRRCTKAEPFTVSSPCAQNSVLVKLQPLTKAVEDARVDLQAAVTACNVQNDQSACSGMGALIKVFNSAITVVRAAMAKGGVS